MSFDHNNELRYTTCTTYMQSYHSTATFVFLLRTKKGVFFPLFLKQHDFMHCMLKRFINTLIVLAINILRFA